MKKAETAFTIRAGVRPKMCTNPLNTQKKRVGKGRKKAQPLNKALKCENQGEKKKKQEKNNQMGA